METKKKIMKSAFSLFAKKGISFSLTEVADAVGIRKASIYAHFENKEKLLYSVIEEEMKKYFFEINQEQDDMKKIFFGVLAYFNNSKTKLYFWKRLLLLPPEAIERQLLGSIQRMTNERFSIVKKLVQKEALKGNICGGKDEEITLMFFSLTHGLLSSVLIYNPQEINQYYEGIWDIFWKGISINKELNDGGEKC